MLRQLQLMLFHRLRRQSPLFDRCIAASNRARYFHLPTTFFSSLQVFVHFSLAPVLFLDPNVLPIQLLEDVQRQRLEVEQAAATMEAASHPHTIHDTLVYSLRGETSAMAPLLLSQQDLEVDAELDRARIQRAVDAELAAAQARLQLELRGVTVADSDGSLGSPDADATDSLYPRSTQPAPAAAPQRLSPARLQAPPSSPPTTWRPAQEPHYFASEAPLDNLPPFRTTRASRLREEKARHQRAQLAGRPAAAGRDGARKGIIKKPSSFARRGPIASLVRGVGPSEAGSRLKPQQFRPALDPQPLTPPRAGGRHSSPSSTTARSLAFDLASTTNDGAADSGRPYATLADLRPLAPAILSALRRSGQVQPPAGGEVEAFGSGNSERKGMAAGAQPSPSRTPSSPGASPHDQSVGVRAALHSPQVISPSTRSPERITSPTRSPAPPSAASLPASPARASIGVGFPSPRSIPEVHQMDTATSPIQFSPTSPIVVQPLRRQSSLMAAELEQQPWTPQSSRATAPAASPQRASIGTQMTPQTSAAVLPAAAQTSPFVGHDKAASATLPAPLSPVSIPLGSMLSPQRRRSSGAEATGARSRLAEGVDEEDDVEEEDEEDDEASWLHSTMPSPRRQPQQRSAAVATSPTAAPATRTQAVSPIGGPSRRDADAQVSPGLARLEPRFPAVDPAATPLAAGGDTSILEQAQALPAAGAVVEPTLWTPQSSVSSMSSAVLRRARRQAVMSPGEWQVHPDLHSSLSEGELNLRPASAGQNLPRERESGRHRGGKPGQAPHDQALSSRGSISPLSTALGARHQRRQHSQRPSTAETAESTMADSESGSEASTVNYVSSDSDGSPAPRDHRGLQLSPGQLLIYSRPGPVRPAANPWSTPGPRASGLGHRLYSDPSARRKDAAKTRRVAPTEEQQRGARVSGLGDALVSDTDG